MITIFLQILAADFSLLIQAMWKLIITRKHLFIDSLKYSIESQRSLTGQPQFSFAHDSRQ